MTALKKTLLVVLSAMALLAVVATVVKAELRREIVAKRQQAERSVHATLDNIAILEHREISVSDLTNAAVSPARIQVLSTNPILFRVEAHTDWPDWMIYEYDSRSPEVGVRHYLF